MLPADFDHAKHVIPVPVGVEERLHGPAAGQAGNGFHDRIGCARGTAIDKDDPGAARVRDDVRFAGDPDDEEVAGKPLSFRRNRRLRGEAARHAQHHSSGAANGGLEQISTGQVLRQHGQGQV